MQQQTIPQIATVIDAGMVRSGDAYAHMDAGVPMPGRLTGKRAR